MKKVIFYISLIGIIICSCNANEDETTQSSDIQLTEAFVELGIKYGPEDRQFLDLFVFLSFLKSPPKTFVFLRRIGVYIVQS